MAGAALMAQPLGLHSHPLGAPRFGSQQPACEEMHQGQLWEPRDGEGAQSPPAGLLWAGLC